MKFVLFFLCYAGACLPAALYRDMPWRKWGWTLVLCPVLCAVLRCLGTSAWLTAGFFALGLGIFCAVILWDRVPMWALLLWGAGTGSAECAVFFTDALEETAAMVVSLPVMLLAGGGLGVLLRWFSQWEIPARLQSSQERSVSPLVIFGVLEAMGFAAWFIHSPRCVVDGLYTVACQGVIMLMLWLWRSTAAAVVQSQKDSSSQRGRVAEIESADRLTLARLQQDISRFQIMIEEIDRAFNQGEYPQLRELLREATTPRERPVFCDVPLLDTVLLRCCNELREAGWRTDAMLDLDGLEGIAAADIGVLLDLVLHFLMEADPTGDKPTVRLRVQECGGVLAVAAGCTGQLREIPREKWEAIYQTVREQNGWCEWTEVAYGVRLNAVLYKKT